MWLPDRYAARMHRWFWVLDSGVVVSFVAIGRDSHGFVSDMGDLVRVAAPFLLALGMGIAATRAWNAPTTLVTGLTLAASTLIIGMALRRIVFDGGTAPAFVIVAGAWLVGLMVGWRLVGALLAGLRER